MKNKGIMSIAPRTSASLQAVPRETVIRGQPHRLAYINPVEEQAHGRTGAWTMNSSFRCEKSQWAAAHAPVVAVVAEEEPAPWTFENWGTRQKA